MAWGVFWISLILCHPIMADTMTIQWPLFVKQTPYGTRFTVRDHKKTIRVVINQTVSYSYGDTIQLTGTSRGCRRARNRGMFDECRWWYRQGIDAQWRIDRHHRLATSQKPAYLIYLSNMPTRIYTTLQQYFPNHAGLAYTFIFGSRVDMVDSRQKMNFLSIGLVHLLVVSGAQISLISMAIFGVGRVCRCPFLLVLVGLLMGQAIYLTITGVDASILRAVIMTDSIMIHRYYWLKRYPFWWYLAVSAVLVAIMIPNSVLSPGFWYSFFITCGLGYITPYITLSIHGPRWMIQYISASMVAILCALPIQLIQTNTIQPMSLVANLWVSWMSSVVLFFGLGVIVFDPMVPWVAQGMAMVSQGCLTVMVTIADRMQRPPISIATPLNYWLAVMSVLIPITYHLKQYYRTTVMVGLLGTVMVLAWLHQRLMVVAIDVQQGDATLVLDGFKSVLIDTGGVRNGQSIASTHIQPVLNYYGIQALDAVVITHHDTDHIGGLDDLTKRGVHRIITPKPLANRQTVVAGTPMTLSLNRGHLDIIPIQPYVHHTSSNHQAFIVTIYLKRHTATWTMLITGDIDDTAEIALIQANIINQPVHVLKLGHHGSRFSTSIELLRVTQPQFVWNSAGSNNRYGHPHPSIIQRVVDHGIPWQSTHVHGSIYMAIRRDLRIESELDTQRFRISWGI